MTTRAIIDGPFAAYRSWVVGGATEEAAAAMFGAVVPLALRYLWLPATEVWVVWEQPGQRGLDFRRKLDPGYKARREAKPEAYLDALGELQRALPWMGVNQAWPREGEADDAAATLAAQAVEAGMTVELWTADHDWLQLVLPGVSLYRTGVKEPGLVTALNIRELTGHDAREHLALMALAGDTGDDIPGLPKIGKGRAEALLAACPTIVADLLDHEDSGADAVVERQVMASAPNMLRWAQVAMQHRELLRTTRELVTLRQVDLHCVPAHPNLTAATGWLHEHGLERYVERLIAHLDPDPWLVADEPEKEPWE